MTDFWVVVLIKPIIFINLPCCVLGLRHENPHCGERPPERAPLPDRLAGPLADWLVGSKRQSGLFVLCCVLFAPSPLGDNSHSAASSTPGHHSGPRKFISMDVNDYCGDLLLTPQTC